MIVTCEKCSTQFQLDDSRVPKGGAKVRCSRCKHAFRVVPAQEPAAEPPAEQPARRARGDTDTKEITHDIPQEAQDGSWPPAGNENEESDWRFNDDSRAGFIRGTGEAAEPKPDPPEAAPPARASRLGDEWFGGGGDAPLELDDRPRGGAAVAEPDPEPEPAPPPEPPPPPPSDLERMADPPAHETPAIDMAASESSGLDLGDEPAFDAGFAGDLGGDPSERLASVERRAPKQEEPSDELGGDTWDLLGDADQEPASSEAPAKPAKKRRRRPSFDFGGAVARVFEWVGHAGTLIGWTAATTLFGYGLYAGLRPLPQLEPLAAPVAGLELTSLDGRMVENVAQGALWVVTGRVRNSGAAPADLGSLALELLDARGEPLATERVALHAPLSQLQLREAPAPLAPPRLAGRVGPGEERSFEAVLATLPPEAVAYRLVGGDS